METIYENCSWKSLQWELFTWVLNKLLHAIIHTSYVYEFFFSFILFNYNFVILKHVTSIIIINYLRASKWSTILALLSNIDLLAKVIYLKIELETRRQKAKNEKKMSYLQRGTYSMSLWWWCFVCVVFFLQILSNPFLLLFFNSLSMLHTHTN